MKKETKENIIGFIFMAVLAFLMAYMVVRDMEKDTARECGMKRFSPAPQYCEQWWDANGVKDANAE